MEKKQIEDALSAFNNAIEINPGNSAAYFSRGRAYLMQGKVDNAISDYSKAIEISPEFTVAIEYREQVVRILYPAQFDPFYLYQSPASRGVNVYTMERPVD